MSINSQLSKVINLASSVDASAVSAISSARSSRDSARDLIVSSAGGATVTQAQADAATASADGVLRGMMSTVAGATSQDSKQDDFFVSRAKAAADAGAGFAATGARDGAIEPKQRWNLTLDQSGDYLWVFSKTLQHDPVTYLPQKAQVDQVLDFFDAPTHAKLAALPSSATATLKLEDPAGGLGFEPICQHQSLIQPTVYYEASSAEGVMEQTEVYCMQFCRDLKISDMNAAATPASISLVPQQGTLVNAMSAQDVLDHLNQYNSATATQPNWPVDAGTGMTNMQLLFRGTAIDEEKGQYISQFLIRDVPFANAMFEQKYAPENDVPELVTEAGFLSIQNGEHNYTSTKDAARRIQTLRDIGSLVHNDPAYGLFFNAGLIGLKAGLNALKDPGQGSNFLDTGGPDFLTSIAAVTRAALRTAWVTKWQHALKIRPEVVAGRVAWIEKAKRTNGGAFPASISADLQTFYNRFEPVLIDRLKDWNQALSGGNDKDAAQPFLSSNFETFSPQHPSWGAGHSAVAGACVTILKAFLNTHNADGTARLWTDAYPSVQRVNDTTGDLEDAPDSGETIIGELNKLASNVALGRNISGVHVRSDYAGSCREQGEQVAISYLQEMTKSYYPEILAPHICFDLQKFDGTRIQIKQGVITNL